MLCKNTVFIISNYCLLYNINEMSFFNKNGGVFTKKLLMSVILFTLLWSVLIPNTTQVSAITSDENLVTPSCATCDYKYWRITSTSYIGKVYDTTRTFWDEYYSSINGTQHGLTISYNQKATVSGSFSISYAAIGVSIGITHGTSYPVAYTSMSPHTKKGETWAAYYRKGNKKHKINQKEYHRVYSTGKDAPTGKSKTGYVYEPAAGRVDWVKR